jgi:hypothetical protein
MKRPDGGKDVGTLGIRADVPPGSGVVIEELKAYPMKSIWREKSAK